MLKIYINAKKIQFLLCHTLVLEIVLFKSCIFAHFFHFWAKKLFAYAFKNFNIPETLDYGVTLFNPDYQD